MKLNDPWPTEPLEAPAYVPSATIEEVIAACANGPEGQRRLLILSGPRGEGKTSGGIYACLELADQLIRDGYGDCLPLRVAVIRDTWVNLERTTIVSFKENQAKGLPIEWRDGHKEAVIGWDPVRPHCHFYFFGIERPEDADKLQGFSCAVLWPEEVASAAGLSGGIPAEMFALGVTSLRQPGVPRYRVLATLNPPDEDHWILRVEEELQSRGIDFFVVRHWRIPPGEKSAHFRQMAEDEHDSAERALGWTKAADEFDRYRTLNRAALEAIGRKDLVARLVEGQVGALELGEAVVPNFSPEHVAKEAVAVYRTVPILRCWDNEPSPACAFLQVLPQQGGVNVLGSHAMENTHMEAFIDAWVVPFMGKYGLLPKPAQTPTWGRGPRGGGFQFEDVGDPVLLTSQITAGRVIMQKLGTTLMPGAVEWEERRAAALACFARSVTKGSRRFVLIDPTENDLLLKGLRGRFRYPKRVSSNTPNLSVTAAKAVSGLYSQSPDALFYGLAHKFPAAEWLRRQQQTPAPRVPLPPARTFMSG